MVRVEFRAMGGPPVERELAAILSADVEGYSRLMGDDLYWHAASQRVESHFRDNHSVEAIAGLYEREIAPWTRSP